MTVTAHKQGTRANQTVRPAAWREEALARAGRLRSDLTGLQTRQEVHELWSTEVIEREVSDPLREATQLACCDRMTPREWWTGSQVEECWRRLRQAEEGLLQLVADEHVVVRARVAEAHGAGLLGREDQRLKELRTLLGTQGRDNKLLRGAALEVLRGAHEASDRQHWQMRSFRNQLLGLSVILATFAGVLLGVEPKLELKIVDTGLPATGELALVMFFGMVGALFSAVPSLSTAPELNSPFVMVRQQALLKVVTGAWSAVIGLLVVNAGLGSGATDVSSVAGVLVVAALFGAGQEAVTRFADHKADSILGSS